MALRLVPSGAKPLPVAGTVRCLPALQKGRGDPDGPFPGSLGDPWSHEALTRPSRPQLKEHPERGVYVKGLSMHTVHSVAQCERIMETGWKNRSVGYTLMNKDSSRSHSIFTISIEIYAVGTCRGCWGCGSRSRAPRPSIRNWEKVLRRPGGRPGGPSCAR